MKPIKSAPSATGSITLASAHVEEKDPMKAALIHKGYILIAENEYGVVVRQAKGKPTFLAKTKEGYKEGDKRNTLVLPDAIDRAMKMRVASTGSSVMQYLTQLVMRDLNENGIPY
jgi:aminoglycoside/choline kinase family phosphotransferase